MVDKDHPNLSVRRQCDLLDVCRSSLYRPSQGETETNLQLMRRLDEVHLTEPTYGTRRMRPVLSREMGKSLNRKRIQRLMRIMSINPIYPRQRSLTQRGNDSVRFPYLLRNLAITRPNQVWCADITYVPMRRGFMFLVVIMDWHSRCVLSWRLSNTLDSRFCLEALEEAVNTAGVTPEILNTDQGTQFTCASWVNRLSELGIRISMDGKGSWMDNVVVERFWRSIKYEDLYLRSYADGAELEAGIEGYMDRYNTWRPHQALGYRTPQEVYHPTKKGRAA